MFKKLVKEKVTDYWKRKYEAEANSKPPLTYFKPKFMSLLKPHPLWLTCMSNPFKTNQAIISARLLFGRYASDWLSKKWSKKNPPSQIVKHSPSII